MELRKEHWDEHEIQKEHSLKLLRNGDEALFMPIWITYI